jgi:protein-L-isoaspartate O-methyltransferase
MKKIVYNIISKLIRVVLRDVIIGKHFNGLSKRLYYERAQHLTFLFQNKIKYEENIQSKLKNYLKEGDTVFDIGGNIGQYALPFSEIVGESGKVYSFEPDYKNYAFLQFNVTINKCSNVICLNYGIGRENSEQEFFRDTETGGRRGSFNKAFIGDNFKGSWIQVINATSSCWSKV